MGWLKNLLGITDKKQPVHVDDGNFSTEVLQADVPVLVDFWSDGCGPCLQLEGIVMALAAEFDGRLKVVEANVSQTRGTCQQLGVMSTPTVVYYQRGRVVERVVGFRGSAYHREIIHSLIA